MNRQLSKRLDRLEAKARKRHATSLNTIEDIEEAFRREAELRGRLIRERGLREADQNEYDQLRARLEPVYKAQSRMTKLILREHQGTPLTDDEARELTELKRWCPPERGLEFMKAIAIGMDEATERNMEDLLRRRGFPVDP